MIFSVQVLFFHPNIWKIWEHDKVFFGGTSLSQTHTYEVPFSQYVGFILGYCVGAPCTQSTLEFSLQPMEQRWRWLKLKGMNNQFCCFWSCLVLRSKLDLKSAVAHCPVCGAGCFLRLLLCDDLEFFGPGTFEQKLDSAYKDFLAYCKRHKVNHSQPPFLPKMVPWTTMIGELRCTTCFFYIWL